jgi:polynucleotide 5'-hydroxyl-kinase GRC3/NOL9
MRFEYCKICKLFVVVSPVTQISAKSFFMLSAIAARKARLGLAESPREPQIPPEVPSRSRPSSPNQSPTIPTLRSKRKPVSLSAKRKKNRFTHTEAKRYFQEGAVQHQDVITVEEDDSESEDTGGVNEADGVPTNAASTSQYMASRRWSPSIPVNDSSDEGSDTGEEELALPPIQVPLPAMLDAQIPVLSTFHPILGQNMFHLAPDEVSYLGGSIVAEDAITLVLLERGQTLALVGTYAFTVVHGSISFLGVTLVASRKSYRVFAPRSSPVPVLRCLSEVSPADAPVLPGRFHSWSKYDGAVVILQELKTGVQGLGSVCKIFDCIFEPSVLPVNQRRELRLLPNVHLVLKLLTYACVDSHQIVDNSSN